MGWAGNVLIILALWLVGEKSMWGFVFGAVGNLLWVYVGLKRKKQYDLAFVAVLSTVMYFVGFLKWAAGA